MIFSTLGVTPAQPGYTTARIAPRLGRLTWAKGNLPMPHGLVSVEAGAGSVTITSPVPILVELEGQPPRVLQAGHHELSAG